MNSSTQDVFCIIAVCFFPKTLSGDLPLQKSKPLQLFYKVWMRTYWLIPSKFSKVGIWMGPVEGEDEKTIIHWYRLSSRLQAGPRLNYLWLLLGKNLHPTKNYRRAAFSHVIAALKWTITILLEPFYMGTMRWMRGVIIVVKTLGLSFKALNSTISILSKIFFSNLYELREEITKTVTQK